MKTFFDTSAYAKRFIDEKGRDKVEGACEQASELGLSVICVPEIISALKRRHREGSIGGNEYTHAKRELIENVHDAEIIQLTDRVVTTSVSVLEQSPVRVMDALHIACALDWGAEIFISADKKQLDAAQEAGLDTLAV